MNIPLIRSLSQQLLSPQFNKPEEVVAWMGAMQAQDFGMSKLAVAIRMKSKASDLIGKVDAALNSGKIIRVHAMRPTWQLVASEDLRWMVELGRDSNERLVRGYLNSTDVNISESDYDKALDTIKAALSGGKTLKSKEIAPFIEQSGIPSDARHMTAYLWRGETRGLVCSGTIDKTNSTYALVDERVAPQKPISRDEALEKLATNYFRSHSPATLEDFHWWSGLSITESRKAINMISDLLEKKEDMYLYRNARVHGKFSGTQWNLPAFDEYLIGYHDRTAVLPIEHNNKIATKNGMFYPIIVKEGKVIGSWGWKNCGLF